MVFVPDAESDFPPQPAPASPAKARAQQRIFTSKVKEPGISNPCPALKATFPKCWMSYLFVVVAVLVVLVLVALLSDALLQPVTKAPITSPNSTIRVYVLFIGCATFDQFRKKASTFFRIFASNSKIRAFAVVHRIPVLG